MRKFLTLWIALAATVGISASSFARSMILNDPLPVAAVAAYQGPGDVVTTGWVWWFGLRAFSAATAGTKAANICNSGDANCADVNTLANGDFDVATATGSPLNCGGAGGTCTIKTLYDKSGGTNCTTACDFTQATIANRPTLVLSCVGSIPCIGFSGGASQAMTSPNVGSNLNQPFSTSLIYNRTGNTTNFTDIIASGSAELFGNNAVNTIAVYAGSFASVTVSDSALHAIQATWNNSAPTNTVSVDGTLSNATPGVGNIASGAPWTFGKGGNAAPTANFGELGFYNAAFSGTQQTNLCHNQRLYWTTGGSC